MLKIIFEVLKLSGKYRSRINLAFAISFVKSLLMKVPVIMSVILLENIYNKSLNTRLCVNMALILLAALIIQYIAQMQLTDCSPAQDIRYVQIID